MSLEIFTESLSWIPKPYSSNMFTQDKICMFGKVLKRKICCHILNVTHRAKQKNCVALNLFNLSVLGSIVRVFYTSFRQAHIMLITVSMI